MATKIAVKKPLFKKGQAVQSVKTGIAGKVVAVRNEGRGDWFDVNFSSDPKVKQIKSCRASQISAVAA